MNFRHEAMLYRGDHDFIERVAPFVMEGVAAGEPTLVMVSQSKIEALRERIGGDAADLVEYRDMRIAGANPARIIPLWETFAVDRAQNGGVRMRGVGEPIWPGRTSAQLEECHWHEALINRAFAQVQGFWLICPYDIVGLEPSVVDQARGTHAMITEASGEGSGAGGRGDQWFTPALPLSSALAEPETIAGEVTFGVNDLGTVRSLVAAQGARAGLSLSRLDDFILAVNEVATNSVTHGGGHGVARVWVAGSDLVCEISDAGVITDPLVDRQRPATDLGHARGLWAANRLCDLVQLRSSAGQGSVVRLTVHARQAA